MWRIAVLTSAALGAASILAWVIGRDRPIDLTLWLVVPVAAITLAAFAVSLLHTAPTSLRWDGRAWYLGATTGDPVPGEVSVAIDLGPWMLLRFAPALPGARRRVDWLPIQRRGLESQWHALRCAVYSPRPAAADDTPLGF